MAMNHSRKRRLHGLGGQADASFSRNLWWFLMPRGEHPGELRYRISNNEGYDWADPYARAYRFEDGQEVSPGAGFGWSS